MKRVLVLWFVILLLFSFSCTVGSRDEKRTDTGSLETSIRKVFPDAVPFDLYADSLFFFLYTVHNIAEEQILLGQSSCMDDVINTKTPFENHAVKGPFNLGGLAGLPFTGITGYNAFAHHVPEKGTALIFVGSHIGYSKKEGWGKIEREGQHETTTCCGAVVQALEKLKTPGGIIKMIPHGDDYQEEVIEQLALQNKKAILKSKDPLIAFTKIIYQESEKRILNYPLSNSNFKHLILVVGVIINTDHSDQDYIWVDHMAIYDLEQERELRGMEK
jgi:Limiting CO2-inducible proteins B/C beta carbonyic anhydrases